MISRIVANTFIKNTDLTKKQVDHISGDKNDNSVANLRWCTPQENARNKLPSVNNKSGYTGIIERKNKGATTYLVKVGNTQIGIYKTIAEAKEVRELEGRKMFGSFFHTQPVMQNAL